MKSYRYWYSFIIKTEVGKELFFSGTVISNSKLGIKEDLQRKYGKLHRLIIINKGEF